MQITPDQEREFYDRSYAQHIGGPVHALVCNLQTMRASLADPAQPVYERRILYSTALEHLLAQGLAGRIALDYGCGTGEWGCLIATEGATVTLLDLSPIAIELGLSRARASGVAERVTGLAREAGDLSCIGDAAFDVIYASAALHHTLKYPHATEKAGPSPADSHG